MTQKWFNVNYTDVWPWLSKSPDLKIFENVWGKLVQAGYPNGNQCGTGKDLLIPLGTAWWDLSEDYLHNLYRSLPRRF